MIKLNKTLSSLTSQATVRLFEFSDTTVIIGHKPIIGNRSVNKTLVIFIRVIQNYVLRNNNLRVISSLIFRYVYILFVSVHCKPSDWICDRYGLFHNKIFLVALLFGDEFIKKFRRSVLRLATTTALFLTVYVFSKKSNKNIT